MRGHKNFWDKNADRYDRFMRKDRAAYEEMYRLIRPVVNAKTVPEMATGTGLIAKNIVNAAAHTLDRGIEIIHITVKNHSLHPVFLISVRESTNNFSRTH